MSKIELGVYGVRGSAPISGIPYIRYGGNTASYTLRTSSNTLIFLDAGTGLRIAERQLHRRAEDVYLMISHTHADHIQGFGMTQLPYLTDVEGYEEKKLKIVGPPGITNGLSTFYDGHLIWPVKFTSEENQGPHMFGIDYSNIVEYSGDFQEMQIDSTTTVKMLRGNHPVSGGVVLYRFEMTNHDGNPVVMVYATDNEFDFININQPNPDAENYKKRYMEFIRDADVLIADAQYTKHDYFHRFQGFGHSYHQQIIDLAEQSNVNLLLLTHHHLYEDEYMDELKMNLDEYVKDNNCRLKVKLAQEGHILEY
ncbi:MAG: hypothetical protein ACXAE3_01340 [Candidatus Kariarchaeaceae archaeon]|jgi:ribonuclease BN (tRNA processing enzyme)